VADFENLHDGIEYYYKGGQDGAYRPRPGRLAPLRLRFYTGPDDKLSEVIAICPKLSNFKLTVTGALAELAGVLKTASNSLDRVALVFGATLPAASPLPPLAGTLPGLDPFLESCGYRISSLEIDFSTAVSSGRISGQEAIL
jgi:hypothetical protein